MAVNGDMPSGVFSLLDTDLYKLTMQCAVLKYFPDTPVSYQLTNRTSHMKLNRAAYDWLQTQILKLTDITVTNEEITWLRKTCPYLKDDYLTYLEDFRLRPAEHVKLAFKPDREHPENDDTVTGELELAVQGLWVETILYEIPLLALISESYFKFVDRDWTHADQLSRAHAKGLELLAAGCAFSEFGTRRRRDYQTHALVMQGLVAAQREDSTNGLRWKGTFTGTSNVHLAMRFGVLPIGTVAHEWFMGIAAITDSYAEANEMALQYWVGTFGRGVLAIALTDTFGTPAFLKAFAKPASQHGTTGAQTYAEIFTGVRQDSGDPLEFIPVLENFYQQQRITDHKTIVFSDSLNVEKCIQYARACEAAGLTPSFGVGTFFTNDFMRESKPEEKSVPLNIVIKLSEAGGRKAVKLSDDVGKNMGDDELVRRIKKEVGYEERKWSGGDEAHR